jgi:hypothetical protein
LSDPLVRRGWCELRADGRLRQDPIASRETPAQPARTGFRHPQGEVNESVLEIRRRLVDARESLRDESPAAQSVERLLTACRDFLDAVPRVEEFVAALPLSDCAAAPLLRLRERFATELKLLGGAVKAPAASALGTKVVSSLAIPAFKDAMAHAVIEPARWWPVVVTVPAEGAEYPSYEYDLGFVRCDNESDQAGSVQTRWMATRAEWPPELSPPDNFLDQVLDACFETSPDAPKPTGISGELPDGLDELDLGGPISLHSQRTIDRTPATGPQ